MSASTHLMLEQRDPVGNSQTARFGTHVTFNPESSVVYTHHPRACHLAYSRDHGTLDIFRGMVEHFLSSAHNVYFGAIVRKPLRDG